MSAVFRVLRYLKCTAGLGLHFPSSNDLNLRGHCDRDWGGCTVSGKSVTDFCVQLGTSLISWSAKKQTVTSMSIAETEYKALASITTEIIWLKYLLADLKVPILYHIPVFCDNQAAVDIASNPVQHA